MEAKVALLNAGYWPSNYWPNSYWNQRYWPKYGEVSGGGDSSLLTYYNKKRKRKEMELFSLVKELLEALT